MTVTRLPTAAKRKVATPFLTGDELTARGISRILPRPNPDAPEQSWSITMILTKSILEQMTPKQKRDAQNAVHRFYCKFGGDQARAASAFMAGEA